jgi:aminoglycoside phosphotransferase (APT) family kinase protein
LQDQRLHAAAEALAEFLVDLHRLGVDDIFRELPQVRPTAQSDTERLRAEYGQLVDEGRDRLVRGWCDWIDHVLGDPAGGVVVHGDFHGYNQLWDFNAGELVAVLDFEECGPGDRHFDFRYLPGNSASTELMLAVVAAYERRTEGELSLQRIMAWHILTVLGDALWRTQAGVELPGGGDACSYVDEVQQRLEVLGVSPAS